MSRPPASSATVPARRARLVRRIRLLVAFTIVYNLLEAVAALAAGAAAGSSALLGFGLDSLVEVSSAVGVAWQFAGRDHEARERVALRITSCSFFALAAFVGYHAIASLASGHGADPSRVGIVIAALSLVVMPLVSWLQRQAGRQLGSRSAVADSQQTLLCTYMSAALLLGLVANSLLGWWWADPAAGLGIAALAVREGVSARRGEACCSPAKALSEDYDADGATDPHAGAYPCCDHEPRRFLGGSAATNPVTPLAAPVTDPRAATAPHPDLPPRVEHRRACADGCLTC